MLGADSERDSIIQHRPPEDTQAINSRGKICRNTAIAGHVAENLRPSLSAQCSGCVVGLPPDPTTIGCLVLMLATQKKHHPHKTRCSSFYVSNQHPRQDAEQVEGCASHNCLWAKTAREEAIAAKPRLRISTFLTPES